jgi:DNA repair protein RadC
MKRNTSEPRPQYLAPAQSEEDILSAAEAILLGRLHRLGNISDPTQASAFLRMRLAHLPHEEFHVLFLDSRHRILACEMLFRGTIDGAEVHPRVVAQRALALNAAAVILAHNHPSGNPEPSAADRAITRRLSEALQLLEIRVLDHIVVSAESNVSLASRGWL